MIRVENAATLTTLFFFHRLNLTRYPWPYENSFVERILFWKSFIKHMLAWGRFDSDRSRSNRPSTFRIGFSPINFFRLNCFSYHQRRQGFKLYNEFHWTRSQCEPYIDRPFSGRLLCLATWIYTPHRILTYHSIW